jgi:hypothetical protein
MSQCLLHLLKYSDVSVSTTFFTMPVMSNYLKLVFIIEQCILDTNAGKQLSKAATDV